MNPLVIIVIGGLLAGCGPDADINMSLNKQPAGYVVGGPVAPRFSVSRVGVFDDNIAYNGKRGIYIITDSITGKEYIGVSGIGISETGSHTQAAGKTVISVQDER